MEGIPLHWCISNNIGDALNYWLVKKITGKPAYWVPRESNNFKFICIGSILNWADEHCGVWGAGLANQTDTVNSSARIYSVRGPVSAKIAEECGVLLQGPHGDPALLVSKYYNNNRKKFGQCKVGLIPHYADYHALCQYDPEFKIVDNHFKGIKIINVFDPIEKIADEIKKCQVILSSSLHGLILADAYGVPNKQVKISDYVLGDGTKFYDYFLSVDRTWILPTHLSRMVKYSHDEIVKLVKKEYEPIDIKSMQEGLLETCPFI